LLSIDECNKYEREATVYYFLWVLIYALLGLDAVVLPGLSAMGVDLGFSNGAKYLAGMGGLAAAAYGFFKPHGAVQELIATAFRIRQSGMRLAAARPVHPRKV
jgi:hypothetical protein